MCLWIRRKPALAPPSNPISLPSCRGEISLDQVVFRYALRPERVVLNGLSLHAKAGEVRQQRSRRSVYRAPLSLSSVRRQVVAFCGPSGGGKSSIIALIQRFYEPEVSEG